MSPADTNLPTPPPAPQTPDTVVVDEKVVKTALRMEKAKTLVKNTFTKVGLPVLIGSAAAYVVSRRSDKQDEEGSETPATDTDYDNL